MPKSENVFAINSLTTFYHRLQGRRRSKVCRLKYGRKKYGRHFQFTYKKAYSECTWCAENRQFTHLLMLVPRINRLSNYGCD